MSNDRITVSLDEDARNAIEDLTDRTGQKTDRAGPAVSQVLRRELRGRLTQSRGVNKKVSQGALRWRVRPIGCRLLPLLPTLRIGRRR